MPYLVVSFDFGNSSNVNVHICTVEEARARALYDSLVTKYQEYNAKHAKDGARMLVELVHLDETLDTAYTLFWGNAVTGALCVAGNNVP